MPILVTHILFFNGLIYLILTFGLTLAILVVYAMRTDSRHIESYIAALFISASIHLSIFIVFPVSIDRSVSVSLLNSLQERKINTCGGLTKEQIRESLISTYIIKQDAVQKRIDEQSFIRMIQSHNGCYYTTGRAARFLNFSQIILYVYNVSTD